jgi:hypothetical protein
MFSIKRSAATLGVVAGLLAAAGPASAQVLPGTIGLTTPNSGSKNNIKAVVVLIGANDYGFANADAQHKQASLERENSIECITLCHEGFEIR